MEIRVRFLGEGMRRGVIWSFPKRGMRCEGWRSGNALYSLAGEGTVGKS